MDAVASQINSLTIVYSTVDSDTDQRKTPGAGEFPAQMAGNAENVSNWWRHHDREDTRDKPFIYSKNVAPIWNRVVLRNVCTAILMILHYGQHTEHSWIDSS